MDASPKSILAHVRPARQQSAAQVSCSGQLLAAWLACYRPAARCLGLGSCMHHPRPQAPRAPQLVRTIFQGSQAVARWLHLASSPVQRTPEWATRLGVYSFPIAAPWAAAWALCQRMTYTSHQPHCSLSSTCQLITRPTQLHLMMLSNNMRPGQHNRRMYSKLPKMSRACQSSCTSYSASMREPRGMVLGSHHQSHHATSKSTSSTTRTCVGGRYVSCLAGTGGTWHVTCPGRRRSRHYTLGSTQKRRCAQNLSIFTHCW